MPLPWKTPVIALPRRVRIFIGEYQTWVHSAETLAVFKMLFFRGKDLLDVEKLIATQGRLLDSAYVRRWLVDMMGEGDERVVALDQMLARR